MSNRDPHYNESGNKVLDIELRKIICIRMGCFQLHVVLLWVFMCLIVKTTYAQIEVNILPLTSTQGGTLNASYNQRVSGTPTWLCYRFNSTGPINTSPSCNSPGSSYTIDANSASSLQCTQNTTADSPVSLTWSDTSQIYIRARACTTPSDTQQNDNDNVRIGLPVSVSLSPKMINPGGNITATYTNRLQEDPHGCVICLVLVLLALLLSVEILEHLIQLHQVALVVVRYNVLQVKQVHLL